MDTAGERAGLAAPGAPPSWSRQARAGATVAAATSSLVAAAQPCPLAS